MGIELSKDVILDERTVLQFRHVLEQCRLTEAMFAAAAKAPSGGVIPHP